MRLSNYDKQKICNEIHAKTTHLITRIPLIDIMNDPTHVYGIYMDNMDNEVVDAFNVLEPLGMTNKDRVYARWQTLNIVVGEYALRIPVPDVLVGKMYALNANGDLASPRYPEHTKDYAKVYNWVCMVHKIQDGLNTLESALVNIVYNSNINTLGQLLATYPEVIPMLPEQYKHLVADIQRKQKPKTRLYTKEHITDLMTYIAQAKLLTRQGTPEGQKNWSILRANY